MTSLDKDFALKCKAISELIEAMLAAGEKPTLEEIVRCAMEYRDAAEAIS